VEGRRTGISGTSSRNASLRGRFEPDARTGRFIRRQKNDTGRLERGLQGPDIARMPPSRAVTLFHALDRGQPEPGGRGELLAAPAEKAAGGPNLSGLDHNRPKVII